MRVKVLGWGRPLSAQYTTYHAITCTDLCGAVVTACFGRWPVDEPQEFHPQPAFEVRLVESCLACIEIVCGKEFASMVRLISTDDAAVPLDDYGGGS